MVEGTLADGAQVDVVDLAQPLYPGIPSSPNHPGFKHALLRRHGDTVRVDGTSGANDLLVMGTHTGTHVDALAHVSHEGMLHGGVDAEEAQRGGRFGRHGIDELDPVVTAGVLLDVAALHGVPRLAPGTPVTASDLAAAAERAGGVAPGTAVLVRTGWAQLWQWPDDFLSVADGVPGPTEDAAGWLRERGVRITGSDTTAYEHIPAGAGHARLPVHRSLVVEAGIPIVEMLDLERLAGTGNRRFTFVLAPLPLRGATGSPVRPLALLHP